MTIKYFQTLLFALLLCAPLAAKVEESTTISGRYVNADDSISISIDDFGQVEGFYLRGGVFGELSGTLVDGSVVGQWMQPEGESDCSTPRRDYPHWGRVEISFTARDQLDVRFSACNESGAASSPWTLFRDKD